jgi:hypothetical protein
MLAALRGVAVLGPIRDGGQAFALTRDWLGAQPRPVDRDASLAELARRYLVGHGPAAPADLAAWAGLPLRDARTGLRAIACELTERDDGLVDLAARAAAPETIPPRLLPGFDPYLLGWKDRWFAVPSAHVRRVHPGGGMVRATATVDGLAVGTWTAPRGEVDLELFSPVGSAAAVALQREADEVQRFLATSARPS